LARRSLDRMVSRQANGSQNLKEMGADRYPPPFDEDFCF
jgi:hypothetical protein